MRRSHGGFAAVALLGLASAAPALAAPLDESANVKAVVQSAYVEGVHAKEDAALMRKGFHPDFRMLVLRDGKMTVVTLDEWVGRLEARAKENPNAPKPAIKADYPIVEITGNAAVVRVELYRDGKHTFTDYLSLYKFPDGWMIVGKIFQAHT
jgi:hypothetical protein